MQLDVFLHLPPEALLAAMFSQRSVIHQQKVGVETIKTGSLAQRVPQWLVRPEHLNHVEQKTNREPRVKHCAKICLMK